VSDKTEEASDKRLSDARDKGQVAQSRDAVAAASVAAGLATLGATAGGIERAFRESLSIAIAAAATPSSRGSVSVAGAMVRALEASMVALAPALAASVAGAAAVGALLAGFLFAPQAAIPSLERLDPSQVIDKFTKPRTYVEPLAALAKGALLLYLGYSTARSLIPAWALSPRGTPLQFQGLLGATLRAVATKTLAVAIGFAAIDVLYRRWQFAQDQRMSKDEVKREHKESEGDPHAKHERERMHKEILEEATVHAVRKAQFVVTNPTHFAVALGWDEETMAAPQLVAKGEGALARRIIDEAHREGIPVLRDAPLARTLHEQEIGDEIPEALYDAVAAIVRYLTEGGDPDRYEG
jgi:flagellar biosynthesis protein FlhB